MQEITVIELLFRGGPLMWPILLCSVIAFSIIGERLLYFHSIKPQTLQLKNDVFAFLKQDRIREAIEFCAAASSPLAKILLAGILKFDCQHEEIKNAMRDASEVEIPKIEQRLVPLATIAHTATLLGLLGTLTGLASTFAAIEQHAKTFSPVTPADIAGGVWQALLPAIAGLLVAIPVYVIYHYLSSRVNSLIFEMELAGNELVTFFTQLPEHKE